MESSIEDATDNSPTLGPSETSPLLADQDTIHSSERNIPHTGRILLLLCITVIAVDFGSYLSIAPQVAIFDSIICRHLRSGDMNIDILTTDNSLCKSPEVQGELALLNGWKDTFDQLAGIILALPYGFMADRVGRKPVLLLSLAGLFLEEISIRLICWFNESIPLRAIWLTPLFQLFGGGSQIATSMVYTIISDRFPLEKMASIFFIVSAVILLGVILATPLSAFLMSFTPWLPFMFALVCEIIGVLSAFGVPETRKEPEPKSHNNSLHDIENVIYETNDHKGCWSNTWSRTWNIVSTHTAFIRHSANMFFIVLAFLLASIGKQTLQLMIQYASRRFSWTIAHASFLITLKGIITLVALLLLLPRLSLVLSKHMSAMKKDFRIAQGSIWLLAFGTTLMALAATPPLFIMGICFFALGWGFYSAARSLATGMVAPIQVGVLNTALALAQSTGVMIAGPILAWAFLHGIELDGIWVGLPYMICAALFGGASLLISSISKLSSIV